MLYSATLTYIILIVLVNGLFAYGPTLSFYGSAFSIADFVVGVIYIVRDFCQREIGGKVIYAMLLGCFLSYFLASKEIALASVTAFFIGELIDFAIFTYTKQPLSKRLLSSSLLSTPIDSAIFLALIHQLNGIGMSVLTISKWAGIIAIWLIWSVQRRQVA